MIELFYWPTINGKKVAIMLEECGLPYQTTITNLPQGEQFEDPFLKISPNSRMPAIVDHAPADGGEPISVFESGAILMYLAEKYGKFMPQSARGKYEVVQWVVWQMANVGPKFGEYGVFRYVAQNPLYEIEGDHSYAVNRFECEVNRLYGVLNNRLYDRRYIAGQEYSIADMANYPLFNRWEHNGQDIDDFKYVKRWLKDISSRPAVERGMSLRSDMQIDPATYPVEKQREMVKLIMNVRARPAPESGGLDTPLPD